MSVRDDRGMANIRGLDPFPRSDFEGVPRSQRAALEDIRRAGNAVRWARKHGKPTAPFDYAFKCACERLEQIIERDEQAQRNPRLF